MMIERNDMQVKIGILPYKWANDESYIAWNDPELRQKCTWVLNSFNAVELVKKDHTMLATEKGKTYALEQLNKRREENADKPEIDNSSLHAGSPMYFRCKTCGSTIVVPENYISRPSLCQECQSLRELGWLE
jgi:hypothetical protein